MTTSTGLAGWWNGCYVSRGKCYKDDQEKKTICTPGNKVT